MGAAELRKGLGFRQISARASIKKSIGCAKEDGLNGDVPKVILRGLEPSLIQAELCTG
jgi:hypothetical protein